MDETQRAAFDAFARARMGELLRFAHVLCGDPHSAADLVQDALERTCLAWPRIRRQDDPEGYVRRAILNRYISTWRRRRREHLVASPPDAPGVAATGDDVGLVARLAALPPRQRAVLTLRFYVDLSEQQTAGLLGCSVGTVKSQQSKALATLRAQAARTPEGDVTWTS